MIRQSFLLQAVFKQLREMRLICQPKRDKEYEESDSFLIFLQDRLRKSENVENS